MAQEFRKDAETDDRFVTGEWVGFFLQPAMFAGKQRMELALSFTRGHIKGSGSDVVGTFEMQGRYEVETGKVKLNKYYASHQVLYEGWAEPGKGIWGVWRAPDGSKGGFQMWPKGMRDPTVERAAAARAEKGAARKTVLVD